MADEQKFCGRFVSWWDGEYEGECELPEGHGGHHHDGLSWFNDDGEMHDRHCQCWCHIKQPDWCPPGSSHIGGDILRSCGCMTGLFEAVDRLYGDKTESIPAPPQGGSISE